MISALLAGLASKLAAMGVAAKAGIGLGIAATATAGVAAVLPPAVDDAVNADAGAEVTASVDLPTPTLPSLPVDVTLPDAAGFGLGVAADATSGGAQAGAQFGLDIANRATAGTPAAGKVPTSVPAGPPASDRGTGQPEATGLDRARQTPAGEHIPAFVPGPPSGTPAGPPAGTPAGPPAGTPAGGATAGAGADFGLGVAGQTPAAGRIPAFVKK